MFIFRNGNVFINDEFKMQDLFVEKGIIRNYDSKKEYEEVDCKGLFLIPSCIDLNIFPLNKELNSKHINILATKALSGGVSTIFLNPYTNPRIDNEAMNALIKQINENEKINIFSFIASLNSNNELNNIDTLNSLNNNPSAIFTDSNISTSLLVQISKYGKMLNLPLCVFAYDDFECGVAYESSLQRNLGLPHMSELGQIKEVVKIIEIAKFIDIPLIFLNINLASCISKLKNYRNKFLNQVSLPHLIFDENNIQEYNTNFKILPPLLPTKQKRLLIESLKSGQIDLLTSLHNAVSIHYKNQVFENASIGIDSISYHFSVAFTHLVKNNIISINYLVSLLSSNIAKFMKFNKGFLTPGFDADFMIVDLESKKLIDNASSIYHGLEVYGILKNIVIGGKLINS